jgi:hypothetical protein
VGKKEEVKNNSNFNSDYFGKTLKFNGRHIYIYIYIYIYIKNRHVSLQLLVPSVAAVRNSPVYKYLARSPYSYANATAGHHKNYYSQ